MPQWKQFSGNWTVTQQVQAKGAGTWPGIPGAPTIGTATAGVGEVSVAFTAPADPGYPTTLTYEVTSSPDSITASGSASPIVVTGLTNGTEYTFTVTATNDTGTGPASAASNAVTPSQFPSGEIYSAGNNEEGQLGLGDAGPLLPRSSPTQIGSLSTWISPTMPQKGASCVKTDGTLWWWGALQFTSTPTGATNSSPTQVGALTNWSALSSGAHHVLAIKTDGTLWTWGWNSYGQLGQNNDTDRPSPVQIGSDTDWSRIATGFGSSYAIKTDGTLWGWGLNNNGQLAQNNVVYGISSPVQIGALTTWEQISGQNRSVLAKLTNNKIYAWGENDGGELGQNNRTARSSPVQVGALTNWDKLSEVSNRGIHFLMVKTDGTLWSMGSPSGVTGDGTSRSSPVQIGSDVDWGTVFNLDEMSVAVKTNGEAYLWGQDNTSGRAGINQSFGSPPTSPVIWSGSGETNWAFFAGSSNATIFLKK